MPERCTERFDPFIIAERGRSYSGIIPLSQLDRLRDALIDERGDVRYALCFAKDDKIFTIKGCVEAELALECSACTKELKLAVRSETCLGLVSSLDEATLLPKYYEPWLVTNRQTTLQEIIEEELLLAIPIIPRHEKCLFEKAVDGHPLPETTRPFSILADLKLRGDR